jgi:hypothetical protein
MLEFSFAPVERGRAMPNVLIHKAIELRPQTRAAFEAELGRSLQDDEDVSIMAFSTHDSPADEVRRDAAHKLESYFKKIDTQTASVSDEESKALLNESLKNVRPGYRERERE